MSQENVDVVRRAWEAFERHDNEAIFPLYDPEVEVLLTAPRCPAGYWAGDVAAKR